LTNRVRFVNQGDWQVTVGKVEGLGLAQGDVFYYLDPPFYKKSDRLYAHVFKPHDHRRLHDGVVALNHNWLLSYDPAQAIIEMYSHNGAGPKRVDLLYSASAGCKMMKAQELIITNLPCLPQETRLWRSAAEWAAPSATSPARVSLSNIGTRERCG
jgi:hypothetical protein